MFVVLTRRFGSPSPSFCPPGNCPKLTTDQLEDCHLRVPSSVPIIHGKCIEGSGLKPGYYCSIGGRYGGLSLDSGALCTCPALWRCRSDANSVTVQTSVGAVTANVGMCVIPWYTFVAGIAIACVMIALGFKFLRCLFCPRPSYERF